MLGDKERNILSHSNASLYEEKANQILFNELDEEMDVETYDRLLNECYDYLYIHHMINSMINKIEKK